MLEERCGNKKEVSRLLDILTIARTIDTKIQVLRHLMNNPAYACYFCDGYNYNCESYDVKRDGSG